MILKCYYSIILKNDISIIIPIYNEENSLNNLLLAISNQSLLPNEIIFVDSGSQDKSIEIIEEFKASNKSKFNIFILINPLGFPGSNRNYGIQHANNNWIAFLDAGVEPEKNWLSELINYKDSRNLNAVFGVCKFDGNTSLQKSFCAISHGCGSVRHCLPSSLFHISIFNEIGLFEENIRASEDLVWMNKFKKLFTKLPICRNALVNYKDYPDNFKDFINKYYTYEKHSIKSNIVNRTQIFINLFLTFLILLSFFLTPFYSTLFILFQFIIRAIITPITRSLNYEWWINSPISIILAIPALISRDLAKFFARLSSL